MHLSAAINCSPSLSLSLSSLLSFFAVSLGPFVAPFAAGLFQPRPRCTTLCRAAAVFSSFPGELVAHVALSLSLSRNPSIETRASAESTVTGTEFSFKLLREREREKFAVTQTYSNCNARFFQIFERKRERFAVTQTYSNCNAFEILPLLWYNECDESNKKKNLFLAYIAFDY